jgi:hypothetical protein
MKPMFDAVKGNCIDRLEINGIDHCIYHEDDCKPSYCPKVGNSFEEVMSNCDYREVMTIHTNHCSYTNDDCLEKYCPAIGNTPRRQSSHSYYANSEPGDSQCPTCGSVVMADEITLPGTLQEYAIGFLYGAIGALACVVTLALMITYYPGMKQEIALYIMNHWI